MRTRKKNYTPLDLAALNGIMTDNETAVLLDNARPCARQRYSYFVTQPDEIIVAHHAGEVDGALRRIDRITASRWVFGYIAYEAAYALEKRFAPYIRTGPTREGHPLVWFAAADEPWIYDHAAGSWNKPLPEPSETPAVTGCTATLPVITPAITESVFRDTLLRIKEAIRAGETYQVNFTYDVSLASALEPFSLYQSLRRMQMTPYCGFLKNRYGYVASFSPELFFDMKGTRITVKPMKGTIGRGKNAAQDRALARFLENDGKNRAENLMIVDLLRNDLGRFCRSGSVITKKLFTVETHPTIQQMTSTIQGVLRPRISFRDLIMNLFPCGSVTGAPKIRTMEIIHALETGERGIYCGAFGFVSPKKKAVFNVPIRTLQKNSTDTVWRFRVGSGVIWDSDASGEWEECAQKCEFLRYGAGEFEIIETMRFHNGFLYAKEHIARMRASAACFGYPFSSRECRGVLHAIAAQCPAGSACKVRILLNKSGALRWEQSPLIAAEKGTNILMLASAPIDETNPFLYHKTTCRPWYENARRAIAAGRCFDVAFYNSKGEITEGTMHNLFIEKQGTLYTPPIACGLLPGIARTNLLRRRRCTETVLTIDALRCADRIYCGNSVRGITEVVLRQDAAPV